MIKIKNEIFFEEYEIFQKIFSEDDFFYAKKIRILDLWCGNGRFNLLIEKIFADFFYKKNFSVLKKFFFWFLKFFWVKKNFWVKKIFYWVEKNFFESSKKLTFNWNFSDVLINTKIEDFLENPKNFVWNKKFNFIILSWIFENFLKFDEKILNKIYAILDKKWVVYINFWNYWEGFFDENKTLFREKNIFEVKKYFKQNIENQIKKSDFWENFYFDFFKKQKNDGWNVVLVLKNLD